MDDLFKKNAGGAQSKKFDVDELIRRAKARGVNYPCPCCGGRDFTWENNASIVLGSPTAIADISKLDTYWPCGIRVCDVCGNVQFFALYRYDMDN